MKHLTYLFYVIVKSHVYEIELYCSFHQMNKETRKPKSHLNKLNCLYCVILRDT